MYLLIIILILIGDSGIFFIYKENNEGKEIVNLIVLLEKSFVWFIDKMLMLFICLIMDLLKLFLLIYK